MSAGTSPIALCTTSIQKLMATAASVRVSDFTSTTETAKPSAEASAISCPASISPARGRTITATPTSPSSTANHFRPLMRSPRKPPPGLPTRSAS
jgi:hypothetical protein